jgi:hypothetical protein
MLPEALPYQLRVRDHFKKMPSVWESFAVARKEGGLPTDEEVVGRIVTAITGRSDSHPVYAETARRFRLFEKIDGAGPAITKMVEGPIDLDRLDLFAQETLYALTRDLLLELLQPEWTRTAAVMHLAQQYFPHLTWQEEPGTGVSERLAVILSDSLSNVHDYFARILSDFIQTDPALQARLLERALAFAEDAGLLAVYHQIKSQ